MDPNNRPVLRVNCWLSLPHFTTFFSTKPAGFSQINSLGPKTPECTIWDKFLQFSEYSIYMVLLEFLEKEFARKLKNWKLGTRPNSE